MKIIGIDIGGTKCAVLLADVIDGNAELLCRDEIKTEGSVEQVLEKIIAMCDSAIEKFKVSRKDALIGISCGGPLDSESGEIQNPPNLPGWNFNIVEMIEKRLAVKANLMNDADACALAEWQFGAGRGYKNIVFLTFGTGLGAGLILNGRIYSGSSSMAGEVGHIRLNDEGPVGYGKRGSFEGFCSGGGIVQQADTYFSELNMQGIHVDYYKGLRSVDGKILCQKAKEGDIHALNIYNEVGKNFGKGLSIIIDMLNPELIIAGGVFMRANEFITPKMFEALERECLPRALKSVKIVPSMLGEKIGDFGALVASKFYEK